MEVIGKVGLKNTGKILGAQTKRWKTKVSKGNEITKRILNVSGVKKEQHLQERLQTLARRKPEPEQRNVPASVTSTTPQGAPRITSDINEVMRTILVHVKKMMSVCSLEAKLIFKDYSVSVNKTCEFMELVRCRLILDADKGKIKIKLDKSLAVSAVYACVPPPVKKAKSVINAAMKRIPLQNQAAITKLFGAIFKVLTSKNDRDDVMSRDDVTYDDISMEQAGLGSANKLFSTLSALDLKILCSKNVVVELRRRQILAGIRRQRVVLEAKQGLQILKEPRSILRRDEIKSVLETLAKWVSSHQQFSVWQNIFEVVKCLQAVTYRGKN